MKDAWFQLQGLIAYANMQDYLNHTKNRTPSHMLSNNSLSLCNMHIRVTILVLAVNLFFFSFYYQPNRSAK